MICPTGEAKYLCEGDWTGGITLIRFNKFADTRKRDPLAGGNLIIPGHREAMSPESITTTGSMDSGLALRAPRNDARVLMRVGAKRRPMTGAAH
jgi:hypothetical protein